MLPVRRAVRRAGSRTQASRSRRPQQRHNCKRLRASEANPPTRLQHCFLHCLLPTALSTARLLPAGHCRAAFGPPQALPPLPPLPCPAPPSPQRVSSSSRLHRRRIPETPPAARRGPSMFEHDCRSTLLCIALQRASTVPSCKYHCGSNIKINGLSCSLTKVGRPRRGPENRACGLPRNPRTIAPASSGYTLFDGFLRAGDPSRRVNESARVNVGEGFACSTQARQRP